MKFEFKDDAKKYRELYLALQDDNYLLSDEDRRLLVEYAAMYPEDPLVKDLLIRRDLLRATEIVGRKQIQGLDGRDVKIADEGDEHSYHNIDSLKWISRQAPDSKIAAKIDGLEDFKTIWLNCHLDRHRKPSLFDLFVTLIEPSSSEGTFSRLFVGTGKGGEEFIYILKGTGRLYCVKTDDEQRMGFEEYPLIAKPFKRIAARKDGTENSHVFRIMSKVPHQLFLDRGAVALYAFSNSSKIRVKPEGSKIHIRRPIRDWPINDSPSAIKGGWDKFWDHHRPHLHASAAIGRSGVDQFSHPIQILEKISSDLVVMEEHRKLVNKNKIIVKADSWRLGYLSAGHIQADWHHLVSHEKAGIELKDIFMGCHLAYEFVYTIKGKVAMYFIPREIVLEHRRRTDRVMKPESGRPMEVTPPATEERTMGSLQSSVIKYYYQMDADGNLREECQTFGMQDLTDQPLTRILDEGEYVGFQASRYYHFPIALTDDAEAIFIKYRYYPDGPDPVEGDEKIPFQEEGYDQND